MSSTTAAPVTTTPRVPGKRAFWTMAVGLFTNTLALAAWAIGGPLPVGHPAQQPLFIVAVFLQVAAASMLLGASIGGVILLIRRSRPLVWPLLAALGVPIALVLTVPKLFLFWLFFG